MQQWEYSWMIVRISRLPLLGVHYELELKDRTLKGQEIWDFLNEIGRKGWELVSVVPETITPGYALWFKRPVKKTD